VDSTVLGTATTTTSSWPHGHKIKTVPEVKDVPVLGRHILPTAHARSTRRPLDSCPGLPWSVLAAIGKVETDHRRSTAPGVTAGANFAGAAGPMQIGIGGKAGNTFAGYAIDADGGGASVYNPIDAIFTAASEGLPPGAPAEEVAAAAVQFTYSELGKPYRWGATGELGLYDCSGLMLQAYQAGGLTVPRTSRQQWSAGARKVIVDRALRKARALSNQGALVSSRSISDVYSCRRARAGGSARRHLTAACEDRYVRGRGKRLAPTAA
jgi:hypothetical protein